MKTRLVKKVLVVCAALMTLSPVMGDEFKNSVVNMKFTKDAAGNLRVNVVTAKPYNNPVFVNKKEDNRYVILLPETSNSMSGKPVIDNVAGTVSGVAIKTQPYSASGCKGYTKITITSPHPIRVSAHASVPIGSAPVQVVKSKTTPAQTAKPVAKPAQTVAKAPASPANKPITTLPAKPTKPVVTTTPKVAKAPTSPANKPITTLPPKPTKPVVTTTPKVVAQSAKTAQPVSKPSLPVVKTVPVTAKKQVLPKATNVENKIVKNKSTTNKIALENKSVNKTKSATIKPAENKVVKPIKTEEKPIVAQKTVEHTKTVVKPKVEDDFDVMPQPDILIKEQKQMADDIKQENETKTIVDKVSNNSNTDFDIMKLLMILSAIGLPILALIFILSMNKKMKQKLQMASVEAETPTEEEPVYAAKPVEEQAIEEAEVQNMLQEEEEILSDNEEQSFANIINEEQNEYSETIDSMPLEQEIDEILDDNIHEELSENEEETIEEDIVQENVTEEVEESPLEDNILDEIELEEVTEGMEDVQATFGGDDEVEPQPVVAQDDTVDVLSDEVAEDTVDDIDETPDNDLVEVDETIDENIDDIAEEVVVDDDIESEEDIDEQSVSEDIETLENGEDVDIELSDVKINEEPIVSETSDDVLLEDTESEIEPKEIEEILSEANEDISDDETVEQEIETEDLSTDEDNETVDEVEEEYTPDGFITEFEPDIDDDSVFEELRSDSLDFTKPEEPEEEPIEIVEEAQDDEVFDELRDEYVTVDGLTVLSKADLTETSGFYLVNFENFSSLIGYINEEIFVLKTFDEFVNNEIYVKVAEQLSDKVLRYIVKIGLYKMVIEVTDKKMSHLIDL